MTLRNAFENLATESKQNDLNAIAAALLSATQALQLAVDALNTKTVAVNTGDVTVSNQPVQPLTEAQLRSADVPVTLDGETILAEVSGVAQEATLQNIYDTTGLNAEYTDERFPVPVFPAITGIQPAKLATPVALAKEHIFDLQTPLVSLSRPAVGNVLLFQDCLQYRTVAIQIITDSGVSSGVVSFEGSNAIEGQVSWALIYLYDQVNPASVAVNSLTLAANANRFFVGPVNFRFLRVRISTAVVGGTVSCSAMFRMTPFAQLNNLNPVNVTQFGGTAIVTGGLAGVPAVGGNVAPGVAPTTNPISIGGVDYAGLTRRELTDSQGHKVVVGPDATRIGSNPVVVRGVPGQWNEAELLELILMELKLQSFYLKEMPVLLNMPGAIFKEEISDFIGNPDKLT